MFLLLTVPIYITALNLLLKPREKNDRNTKIFMVLCSIALIFIIGLRTQHTGSTDTQIYLRLFDIAKKNTNICHFLKQLNTLSDVNIFSECGFYIYLWVVAIVFKNQQWLLIMSAVIIVIGVARFIKNNSEDFYVSWMVYVCLGSMTFAMNGMRQAIAMSICLLADEFSKKRKIVPFLLLVLVAMLFHKSAFIFAIVYVLRGMKFNILSLFVLASGVFVFLITADKLISVYDTVMGEDYLGAESMGTGIITLFIYLIAIVMILLFGKCLGDKMIFAQFSVSLVGATLYMGRFFSNQIYERISYYFFFYLMLLFPSIFRQIRTRERQLITVLFSILAFVLYAYRVSKGTFSNYELFW